jgi:CO dehydrogenase/acetyl-CoA synthase beta subunit
VYDLIDFINLIVEPTTEPAAVTTPAQPEEKRAGSPLGRRITQMFRGFSHKKKAPATEEKKEEEKKEEEKKEEEPVVAPAEESTPVAAPAAPAVPAVQATA